MLCEDLNDGFVISNEELRVSLVRRRGQVKATLTSTVTRLDKFIRSEVSIGKSASRLVTLLITMAQFDEIQLRIQEVDTANDIEHMVTRDESETKYHRTVALPAGLIKPIVERHLTKTKNDRVR